MTTEIAKNTTLGDTFESNYVDPQAGTKEFIRELSENTATEVETSLVFTNSETKIIVWHIQNPEGLDWTDGIYTWLIRTGAVGDPAIDLDQVFIRRVSADGLTVRASISSSDGLADPLTADKTITDTINDSGGTLNPGGKAADDHIVLVFELINTSTHGGDDTTSVEQNLSTSTRLLTPEAVGIPTIIPLIANTPLTI